MLSGYLLLDINKTIISQQFFKKTFFRIIIPLISWSLIYLYFRHIWHQEQFNLNYIVDLFISSKIFHLYYLFIILGFYLITPPLKEHLKLSSQSHKVNLVIGAFCFGFFITLITYILPQYSILISAALRVPLINSFTIFSVYLGYYLAGDSLRKFELSKKQATIFTLLCFLLVFLTSLLIFLVTKLSLNNVQTIFLSNGGNYFGEYLSLNIIGMSLSAFVLLLNIDKLFPQLRNKLIVNIVIFISSAAFGIYLIHPIMIDLLDHYANLAIHLIHTNLWLYILEKISLVFILSLITVLVLLKTPILNKLFGEK